MTQATYNSNEMFSECLDPRYQFKVEVASDYDSSDYEEIDLGLKDEEKTVFDNCNQLVKSENEMHIGAQSSAPSCYLTDIIGDENNCDKWAKPTWTNIVIKPEIKEEHDNLYDNGNGTVLIGNTKPLVTNYKGILSASQLNDSIAKNSESLNSTDQSFGKISSIKQCLEQNKIQNFSQFGIQRVNTNMKLDSLANLNFAELFGQCHSLQCKNKDRKNPFIQIPRCDEGIRLVHNQRSDRHSTKHVVVQDSAKGERKRPCIEHIVSHNDLTQSNNVDGESNNVDGDETVRKNRKMQEEQEKYLNVPNISFDFECSKTYCSDKQVASQISSDGCKENPYSSFKVQCRHIRKVGKSRQKPIIISKGKKNIKKAKSNSKQKQQVDQPDELCKIVHDEFDSDVDVLTDWDGSKEFRSKMLKQWIALEHDYSGKKTINHLAKLPQHGKELCTEKRMKKMKKEQAQCGDRELRGVMHNSLERKRRHEMSNLFLELGKVVYSPIKWIMLNRPTKKGIIQRALQQIEKLKLSSLDINVQRYNLKIQIEHNRAKIKRLRETFDEANTV
ncbi:uncharacterized protein LOC128219180 [Mya arenaria]|uniref:uncharacterized protein LOC128219180 n=1 Tax=Mya arenaria TaxID=6604 RepID=UPI0022E3256F|nr:uncharacterized protein LOC128219180 [Mya arenaria]